MIVWVCETNGIFSDDILSLENFLNNVSNPFIITDKEEIIVGVNESWLKMCDYEIEDIIGKTPRLIQGVLTDKRLTRIFSSNIRSNKSSFVSVINYTKNNTPFINHLFGYSFGDLFIVETYAKG